jgi:polysaccharide pyruvyl transferase WcaK-like protein
MNRLFVLNGGAAVRDDNRSAYLDFPDPVAQFKTGGINTGDVLVYDAILKQLDCDEVANVQFTDAADRRAWPEGEFYSAIVRGSNYITPSLDLSHVVPLLESIKTPIVAMGIGAQAADYRKLELTPGTLRALKIIADKSVSVGVRGFYSAEVLNDHGIKNVRVIGCPSFYRSLMPKRPIGPMKQFDETRVGITLNRYLTDEYASDAIKTNRTQRALLQEASRTADSHVYSQGEQEETLVIYSEGREQMDHARLILRQYGLDGDAAVESLLLKRMVASFDVDEWTRHVARNVDLMVGFRLHGNVIALHQGIPAVFFTYDARIRELADFFGVPSIEVDHYMPVSVQRIHEALDFSQWERQYARNYAEYVRFLDENGLQHRLPRSDVTEVPASAANRLPIAFSNEELSDWFRQETTYLTSRVLELRDRAWNTQLELDRVMARRATAAG